MAFFSKFGGILRQASSRNVTSDLLRVNSSIFQGVRWMSTPSSKVFIGGIAVSFEVVFLCMEVEMKDLHFVCRYLIQYR